MNKIDTSKWKQFAIGDLFEVKRPSTRSQTKYSEGSIPFVASGNANNGVVKYCEPKAGEKLDKGNCISVSPLDGTAFYQPKDFLGRGGAGSAILLLYNPKLSEFSGLFIATAIRSSLTRFSYSDQLNSQTILKEQILLPVDSKGQPDWNNMESYMESVLTKTKGHLDNLRLILGEKTAANIAFWKEFEIGSLFTIVKGKRLTKANMKPGNIRFIGASATNNGWTTSIGNNEYLHPANTLTVCYNGSVGETFYQNEPFWASDDVNVLYPKFSMTENIGLFMAPLIRSVGQKYFFTDKWRKEIMEKDKIKLPVCEDGSPDWSYMESYMQEIFKSNEYQLNSLRNPISD